MKNKISVLVIKPKGQADSLCEKLTELDMDVTHIPTLEIKATPYIQNLDSVFSQLQQYQIMIFTSVNSVKFSYEVLVDYWPTLPEELKVASIGPSTSKALTDVGIPVHIQPKLDFSSEGLLQLKPLVEIEEKAVLIVKGEGGRPFLADTLQERGAEVDTLECYQRVPLQIDIESYYQQWQKSPLDWIVATSQETLDCLFALFNKPAQALLRKCRLLVSSQRLVEYAIQMGFDSQLIMRAQNATEEAIINSLQRWKEQ